MEEDKQKIIDRVQEFIDYYYSRGLNWNMVSNDEIYDIEAVLDYTKELIKENTMLQNTKNMCPVAGTSGIRCELKKKI